MFGNGTFRFITFFEMNALMVLMCLALYLDIENLDFFMVENVPGALSAFVDLQSQDMIRAVALG